MLKKYLKKYLNNKQKEKLQKIRNKIKNLMIIIKKEDLKKLEKYEKEFPEVMSTSETLDLIIKNKVSICRFGDAEFDICNFENKKDIYQIPSKELTNRLKEVIKEKSNKKLLICIPPFNSKYNNLKNYYGKLSFWEWYWLKRFVKIKSYLVNNKYGNSFISRDSVFYENELNLIKKIWDNREVVFVYGNKGRFEIQNEIFDNIKEFNKILISPTNAFDMYESVLSSCLKYNKNKLFLIAAGPTATVLAFDLYRNGYQALDIGHLPNCYDQYRGIIKSPECLPLEENI